MEIEFDIAEKITRVRIGRDEIRDLLCGKPIKQDCTENPGWAYEVTKKPRFEEDIPTSGD